MSPMIQAAGGLVLRAGEGNQIEVLVAHRPAYDDWSLPKGKVESGEPLEDTAVREVMEETGYRCRVVARLGTTRHQTMDGTKEVTWFAMRCLPRSPGFTPSREIDDVRWVTTDEAGSILDYENDRLLLARSDLVRLVLTGTIRLLRHAPALDRKEWRGGDKLRPLSEEGNDRARTVAEALAEVGVDRVVTSPYLRCVETVRPLAEATGAEIELSDALAEGAGPRATARLVASLYGYNAVLCSHGDVIPALLDHLAPEGLELESPQQCPLGSIWEVDVIGGKPVKARLASP